MRPNVAETHGNGSADYCVRYRIEYIATREPTEEVPHERWRTRGLIGAKPGASPALCYQDQSMR